MNKQGSFTVVDTDTNVKFEGVPQRIVIQDDTVKIPVAKQHKERIEVKAPLANPEVMDIEEYKSNKESESLKPILKSVDSPIVSDLIYDKSVSYGLPYLPYRKTQDAHSWNTKTDKIAKEPERVENATIKEINDMNLTYGYGTHVEQGRVIIPIPLPMDRKDRVITRGCNENLRNVPDPKPLGLYELSGLYGKNRMIYNKSLEKIK